jgi:DNA-binding response OmpR family regulator
MAARILVLDDDPDMLDMLELALSELGYDVRTTQKPAIPAGYAETPPDLILLDWLFQGQARGMHVLKQLEQHPALAQVPVIVCCGLGSEFRETEDWLRAQGVAVLYKPYDLGNLDAAITAGLRSRRF